MRATDTSPLSAAQSTPYRAVPRTNRIAPRTIENNADAITPED